MFGNNLKPVPFQNYYHQSFQRGTNQEYSVGVHMDQTKNSFADRSYQSKEYSIVAQPFLGNIINQISTAFSTNPFINRPYQNLQYSAMTQSYQHQLSAHLLNQIHSAASANPANQQSYQYLHSAGRNAYINTTNYKNYELPKNEIIQNRRNEINDIKQEAKRFKGCYPTSQTKPAEKGVVNCLSEKKSKKTAAGCKKKNMKTRPLKTPKIPAPIYYHYQSVQGAANQQYPVVVPLDENNFSGYVKNPHIHQSYSHNHIGRTNLNTTNYRYYEVPKKETTQAHHNVLTESKQLVQSTVNQQYVVIKHMDENQYPSFEIKIVPENPLNHQSHQYMHTGGTSPYFNPTNYGYNRVPNSETNKKTKLKGVIPTHRKQTADKTLIKCLSEKKCKKCKTRKAVVLANQNQFPVHIANQITSVISAHPTIPKSYQNQQFSTMSLTNSNQFPKPITNQIPSITSQTFPIYQPDPLTFIGTTYPHLNIANSRYYETIQAPRNEMNEVKEYTTGTKQWTQIEAQTIELPDSSNHLKQKENRTLPENIIKKDFGGVKLSSLISQNDIQTGLLEETSSTKEEAQVEANTKLPEEKQKEEERSETKCKDWDYSINVLNSLYQEKLVENLRKENLILDKKILEATNKFKCVENPRTKFEEHLRVENKLAQHQESCTTALKDSGLPEHKETYFTSNQDESLEIIVAAESEEEIFDGSFRILNVDNDNCSYNEFCKPIEKNEI